MKQINVVDGAIVFLPDENAIRIDELITQLTKSVQATCKHPDRINHHIGQLSDGEWYKSYHCENCGADWIDYDEPPTEVLP